MVCATAMMTCVVIRRMERILAGLARLTMMPATDADSRGNAHLGGGGDCCGGTMTMRMATAVTPTMVITMMTGTTTTMTTAMAATVTIVVTMTMTTAGTLAMVTAGAVTTTTSEVVMATTSISVTFAVLMRLMAAATGFGMGMAAMEVATMLMIS